MSADQNDAQAAITQTPGYVDSAYLRHLAERLAERKRRSYELMRVEAGQRVLDVGCGPATATIALAQLVGPSGAVVGVDYDPAMVAEARLKAEQAGVSGWTTHLEASAMALPLETGTFDSVHAERVLLHLPEPDRAIAEMVRVTRPGGRVVVLEGDWAALSIAGTDDELERRYVRFWAGGYIRSGYIGRGVYGKLKEHGLEDVTIEVKATQYTDYALVRRLLFMEKVEQAALTAGALTQEEVGRWQADLACADSEGRFLTTMVGLIVAGTKA